MGNINVLVLGFADPANANTISDHLYAFENLDGCNVFIRNNFEYVQEEMFLPPYFDLDYFDVLIFHYSIYILGEDIDYLSDYEKERITNFNGLKIFFRQDEYYKVDSYVKLLNDMKADVLFTCVPSEEIEKVYPKEKLPNLLKVNTLTGYVPDNLIGVTVPKIKDRKSDVVYRGRTLPYWYGELGQEKVWIADKFLESTKDYGLVCDISVREEDRIYGSSWIDFIANSKATLGTESGASVFDFSGELKLTVDAYMREHPRASFYAVQEKYLVPYEDKIYLHQISPRAFESICLKTAMILFEGNYSGILKPWTHYIPLKKDFSNIKEVIEFLNDDSKLEELVERAYSDIVLSENFGYNVFAKEVAQIIKNELSFRKIRLQNNPACSKDMLKEWMLKQKDSNTIYITYGDLNIQEKFISQLLKYTNLEIHNYCEKHYDYTVLKKQCKIMIYNGHENKERPIRKYISEFMPSSSKKTKFLVYAIIICLFAPIVDILMLPIRIVKFLFPSMSYLIINDPSVLNRFGQLSAFTKFFSLLQMGDYIFKHYIKNNNTKTLIIDNIFFAFLLRHTKRQYFINILYVGQVKNNLILNKIEKIFSFKIDHFINLNQRGRELEKEVYLMLHQKNTDIRSLNE